MSGRYGRQHRSLARGLDADVLTHVRRYVDISAQKAGASQTRLTISPSAVYNYIIVESMELSRKKKQVLEKSIDKALQVINAEADESDDDEEAAPKMDSDFETFEDRKDLMTPSESAINAANRKVTDRWGISGTSTPTAARAGTPPAAVVEPVGQSGSIIAPAVATSKKKRKERRDDKDDPGGKRKKPEKDMREPPQNLRLKDLGGVEKVALQLWEDIVMPLQHPEIYEHTGITPPRGVLLHGPPGCGKTMLANAIAGEVGLPFISVSAPSIVSGMSGESEKKLRELFDEAKERAPCLVFLDEIDAITPKRESVQREMERRIVAQMLTCMDELTLENLSGKAVIIIAATNRPDSLDPALRRAGRFDKEICLSVPDELGRENILRVLCRKLRLSGDFDFKALAKMTPGFVGADLNSLTSAAGTAATKRMFNTLMAAVPDADPVPQPPASPSNQLANGDSMDLDNPQPQGTTATSDSTIQPDQPTNANSVSVIERFLNAYPSRLTTSQLDPLRISQEDFLTALPSIQPSSKREGFATVPDVTWADIGALHPIRAELQMAIVQPIAHPEIFASVGITAPTGVLLWGPPGCGKTLLAKAVANESNANFISIRGPELLNKFVGESERAVRQVFSRARASKPCVIFFDELDALVPRRDDALSESSARVVNTLLTELDGLEDRAGVFVVGATNRPDVIDPAMLRPGRLDKPLLVDLPEPEERVEILKTLTKKTPLAEDVELEAIGKDKRAHCYSGADLAALVREAGATALRRVFLGTGDWGNTAGENMRVVVGKQEFEDAFAKVRPSVGEDEREGYRELATRFGVHASK